MPKAKSMMRVCALCGVPGRRQEADLLPEIDKGCLLSHCSHASVSREFWHEA